MTCRGCDREIPGARMRALPDTKYCVGCQIESENVTPIVRRGQADTNGVVLMSGEQVEPMEEQ